MIIGISGGTGSGKTTVAKKIIHLAGQGKVAYLQQDSYYHNLNDLPVNSRHRINFDHPDAFDNELLIHHLEKLKNGESINQPIYDYSTHSRKTDAVTIDPHPVIIVEGILIFVDRRMRTLMDLKIFVDTDADLRLIRRINRDVRNRHRTLESVIFQYTNTVRPMHLQFVEPSKRYADIIIPEGGNNEVGIDLITEKIKSILEKRSTQPN